jgi:hypothetical protein
MRRISCTGTGQTRQVLAEQGAQRAQVACGLQSRFHALPPFGQYLMFGSIHLGDTVRVVGKTSFYCACKCMPRRVVGQLCGPTT